MDEFFASRWFLVFLVLGGFGVVIASILSARSSKRREKAPISDYLLVLPLIFRRGNESSRTDDGVLTKREWIGWAIVLLLALLGILFFP